MANREAEGPSSRWLIGISALARISHRAVQRASSKFMINLLFRPVCRSNVAVHAEPIAALDALKPASLALQSTHSPCYGQIPLKRASRAARVELALHVVHRWSPSLAIPVRIAG